MLWTWTWTHWILGALAVFWAVGAYNRLVRARARVAAAFASLDAQWMRFIVWLQGQLPGPLRDPPMPDDTHAEADAERLQRWVGLSLAATELAERLAGARARALGGDSLPALVQAQHRVLSEWSTLPRSLASAERHSQFLYLLGQLEPLRGTYNDAVQAYNQAIHQFPALLLARLLRLGNARTLPDAMAPPETQAALEAGDRPMGVALPGERA
jgi:LemA protein